MMPSLETHYHNDNELSEEEDSSEETRTFAPKSAKEIFMSSKGPISSGVVTGEKRERQQQQQAMLVIHLNILGLSVDDSDQKGQGASTPAWVQLGRWIKYEERVESDAERLGIPQIPVLTYQSIQHFRHLLAKNGQFFTNIHGEVTEDIMVSILESICTSPVSARTINLSTSIEKQNFVQNVLLSCNYGQELKNRRSSKWIISDGIKNLRRGSIMIGSHHLVDDGFKSTTSGVNKDRSSHRKTSLQTTAEEQDTFLTNRRDSFKLKYSSRQQRPSIISMEEDLESGTKSDSTQKELALVLVGSNEVVQHESISFVRLSAATIMPEITEGKIPVRFICLVLSPSSLDGGGINAISKQKELGRSISTLLANNEFQKTIYHAQTKHELLQSIDSFLGNSIIIPPGKWDSERFPFDRLKRIFKNTSFASNKQRRNSTIIAPAKSNSIITEDEEDNHVVNANSIDLWKEVQAAKIASIEKKDAADDDKDHDSLRSRTRKPFGGLIKEACRRFPLYLSDLKDGLNIQGLATIIFVYFACVAGNIAFGGLMSTKTENYIGISETLMSAAIGGTIFALFSAQPLLIVGTTGPMLVFDESLFKLCKNYEMTGNEFLTIRCWIGIWLGVIALVFTYFDGSCFLRYFTRFTQEIFATLISFVFIVESIKSLLQIYKQHPLLESYESLQNETFLFENDASAPHSELGQPNIALLSTILMFGTYFIATSLKDFRNSGFFNSMIRNTIANFAVLLSILAMGFLDWYISQTNTPKLKLPDASDGLKNSHENRTSWFINPFLNLDSSNSGWIIPCTFIPALLIFIFIFMETGICELIVGKKESKLKKGCGYHLNILLMCLINTLMGLFGLGWVSAPTIRSVAHVSALTVYSINNIPGEKTEPTGVLEQRITGFFVSLFLGISVLMANVLIFVPLAVLFGIFLFMGVTSLNGVQLIDRTILLFKPIELHPQIDYVLNVRRWKMFTFTIIQLLCLGALWIVKESPASLSLALLILLLVPFRLFVLPCWFSSSEIVALD